MQRPTAVPPVGIKGAPDVVGLALAERCHQALQLLAELGTHAVQFERAFAAALGSAHVHRAPLIKQLPAKLSTSQEPAWMSTEHEKLTCSLRPEMCCLPFAGTRVCKFLLKVDRTALLACP